MRIGTMIDAGEAGEAGDGAEPYTRVKRILDVCDFGSCHGVVGSILCFFGHHRY